MPIPDWFIIVAAVVIGACVGSFLNVVVYRLPRQCLSIARPRGSFCPTCKTPIKWFDNIPLLSYLALNAKCRACRAPISMRYPLVEIFTASLFGVIVWLDVTRPGQIESLNAWLSAITHCVFACLLISAALIDADLTVIPDRLTLGGTVVMLALAAANPQHGGIEFRSADPAEQPRVRLVRREIPGGTIESPDPASLDWSRQRLVHVAEQAPISTYLREADPRLKSFLGALFGALAAGGVMWLLRIFATGLLLKKALRYGQGAALGLGDVKLLMLFGALLGWPGALLAVFGGAALGMIVTVPQLLLRNQHLFPFGPFLAAAALLIMLAYGPLLVWVSKMYGGVF